MSEEIEFHGWLGKKISAVFHPLVFFSGIALKEKVHRLMSELWPLILCLVILYNGFRVISFEYVRLLDSYFIHRYIIIKYRSSSIKEKIHRLLSELWTLISVWKMVSR